MKIGYKGKVKITTWHGDGRVEVEEFDNLITNAGLNFIRDVLIGEQTDGFIKYIALGTGEVAPADADTTLGSEQFRKTPAIKQDDGLGRAETISYINPNEGNFHIKELGWFAGDSATGSKDTGQLIARVLYDRDKTNLESIQIERIDEFERGGE